MVLSGLFRRRNREESDGDKRLALVRIVHDRDVSPPALQDLCTSVGWAKRDPELIVRALGNSLAVVSAWDGNLLVGFARATGDKVFNATIWDVAVRPSYQHIGLGGLLMKELIADIDTYGISLITLYADSGREGFYERFGFAQDPSGVRAMFREKC